jgi:peroxiredoxin family protein
MVSATTASDPLEGRNARLEQELQQPGSIRQDVDELHKALLEKMIDIMTPAGPEGMPVSQMNMPGAGAALLKRMMKEKDVISAHELLGAAQESGVKMNVCSMTMQVMGIKKEELVHDIELIGAAGYITEATRQGLTLFI